MRKGFILKEQLVSAMLYRTEGPKALIKTLGTPENAVRKTPM